MEAVLFGDLVIGDVENVSESFDGETTWYATTSHPDTLEVINGEICCTKREAVKAVKDAWKKYMEK